MEVSKDNVLLTIEEGKRIVNRFVLIGGYDLSRGGYLLGGLTKTYDNRDIPKLYYLAVLMENHSEPHDSDIWTTNSSIQLRPKIIYLNSKGPHIKFKSKSIYLSEHKELIESELERLREENNLEYFNLFEKEMDKKGIKFVYKPNTLDNIFIKERGGSDNELCKD